MKINIIKQGISISPASEEDMKLLDKLSDATYQVDFKNLDSRTNQQNKALHLWCKQIAYLLNKAGFYLETSILRDSIEWDMQLVKEHLIKNTIKTIFSKTSTTQLTKKELNELIEVITAGLSARAKIEVPPFPNKELWHN